MAGQLSVTQLRVPSFTSAQREGAPAVWQSGGPVSTYLKSFLHLFL